MQRSLQRVLTRTVMVLTLVSFLGLPVFAARAEAATSVISSAVTRIDILPNDRPTRVPVETDQQFVATAYANDGTVVPGVTFRWKTVGGIGRITPDGIFTGERGGIGTVTASSGDVTASVGVVVKGVAKKKEAPSPTASAVPAPKATNDSAAQSNANTNAVAAPEEAEDDTGTVAGDTAVTEQTCTTLRGWIWVLILLGYFVLLFVYYLALGENLTSWWWLWPLVLTAELFALFWIIRCPGVQRWVPIILLLLGALATYVYVQLLRPKDMRQFTQPPQQS